MGAEHTRISQARLFKDVAIVERPYYLSPEEDDERLERIAEKIIATIRAIETRERGKRGRPFELGGFSQTKDILTEEFKQSFDEKLWDSSQDQYRLGMYIRLSPSDEIRDEGSLVSHPQRMKDFVQYRNTQTPGWGRSLRSTLIRTCQART